MGHRVRVTFTEAEARAVLRCIMHYGGKPRDVLREAISADKIRTAMKRPATKPKVAR